VLLAENGRAAIELLEREPVDLLDFGHQDAGWSAASTCCGGQARGSGHPGHHDYGVRIDRPPPSRPCGLGACDYLSKPFDIDLSR